MSTEETEYYRVSNNTDYSLTFITTDRAAAVKVWQERVMPRADAGDLYWGRIEILAKGSPEGDPEAIWEDISDWDGVSPEAPEDWDD